MLRRVGGQKKDRGEKKRSRRRKKNRLRKKGFLPALTDSKSDGPLEVSVSEKSIHLLPRSVQHRCSRKKNTATGWVNRLGEFYKPFNGPKIDIGGLSWGIGGTDCLNKSSRGGEDVFISPLVHSHHSDSVLLAQREPTEKAFSDAPFRIADDERYD